MNGTPQDVTLSISSLPQGRRWKGLAFRIVASIGLWASFGGWKQPSTLFLVAMGFGAVMLTLTAVIERLYWNRVDIAQDSLTLTRREQTAVIRREDLVLLELRAKAILLKWRGEAKAHVATFNRERYSPDDWDALQANLEPWAKAPEKLPD